jgi:hypothetical protein
MIAATLSSLLVALPGSGTPVLLCPDSLRQTVWAFDATTGAIVSQNVIVDTQYLDDADMFTTETLVIPIRE